MAACSAPAPARALRRTVLIPLASVLLAAGACAAEAATFTVSNRNDSGGGSLRVALHSANVTAGADLIRFQIGGGGVRTITPVTPLPEITETVTLDGTTQSGYAGTPLIEINGAGFASGLTIRGSAAQGTVLLALAVNRYAEAGILIDEVPGVSVRGCHVGTNASGIVASRAPGSSPIGVEIRSAAGVSIGGPAANDRMVVSGNAIGIKGSGATLLSITHSFIGTDVTGATAIPNDGDGVVLLDCFEALVGGTTPGSLNVISGNGGHGVSLIGSPGEAPRNCAIRGCQIGVNASGTAALANGLDGVHIEEPGNEVGGLAPGSRNVISGNVGSGVRVTTVRAIGNFVRGNFIGTNALGLSAVPNGTGVTIESPRCFVGGLGAGNVIAGNLGDGVQLLSSTAVVAGNLVGTSATGSAPIGNHGHGVRVTGPGNHIGGADPVDRNVIAASGGRGILISGSGAAGNIVDRAIVGMDSSGLVAMGNGAEGISIESGSQNVIGGVTAGSGNLISANLGAGIALSGPTANLNQLLGNRIGVGADGSSGVGNAGAGVRVEATGNLVGVLGAGNEIAHNAGCGVEIASGTNNSILHNAIYANGALGIDLLPPGPNPADTLDLDIGANELQNAPLLLFALPLGETLALGGTLKSRPMSPYRIQFFADSACSETAPAEGRTPLGEVEIVTEEDGVGDIHWTYPAASPGQYIVATATDAYQNTSEFSLCLGVGEAIVTGVEPGAAGDRLIAPLRNPFTGSASIRFALARSGAVTLDVVDARGRRAGTLARGDYGAGEHAVEWNSVDAGAGVYWVRLRIQRQGDSPIEQRLRLVKLD